MKLRLLLILMCLGVSLPALAQTPPDFVANPKAIEFIVSADHSTEEFGVPKVDHYEMRDYLLGAAEPVQVMPIGKPTPDANGFVRITQEQMPMLFSLPQFGVIYESRVVAIGPGGEGVSDPSNPFGLTTPPAAPGAPQYRSQ